MGSRSVAQPALKLGSFCLSLLGAGLQECTTVPDLFLNYNDNLWSFMYFLFFWRLSEVRGDLYASSFHSYPSVNIDDNLGWECGVLRDLCAVHKALGRDPSAKKWKQSSSQITPITRAHTHTQCWEFKQVLMCSASVPHWAVSTAVRVKIISYSFWFSDLLVCGRRMWSVETHVPLHTGGTQMVTLWSRFSFQIYVSSRNQTQVTRVACPESSH